MLRAQGHASDLVANAFEARRELALRQHKLALIDLDSLGRDGLPLLTEIRTQRSEVELPVIVVAGAETGSIAEQALHIGANRLLMKPVRAEVLAACAEVVLGEVAVQRGSARERGLLKELAEVDAAISETEARRVQWRPPPSMRDTAPGFTTEEYAAVNVKNRPPNPGDTAQQMSIDWTVFKAMERAFSRAVEGRQPLSVLMVELQPKGEAGSGLPPAFVARVEALLSGDEQLSAINPITYCVALPGADLSNATDRAKQIIRAVTLEPPLKADVRIGVAWLEGGRNGSPFELIDWAQVALQRAKTQSRHGFWVHQGERAYE